MSMKAIRISIILSLILVMGLTYLYLQIKLEGDRFFSEDPRVWQPVIAGFAEQDKVKPPPRNAVVFIGSSSIRFWDSLEEDMQPLLVFGRGFGGAKAMDVSYYVSQIVEPYQPQAVVVYIGSNDLSDLFGNVPKTPAQLQPLYQQLIERLKWAAPGAEIFFIALKPSSALWHLWPKFLAVNGFLAQLAMADPQVTFIDANEQLFTAAGEPDASLMTYDRLHMNDKGYQVWGAEIKRQLLDALKTTSAQ
ncbi:GDSL-type esterase/lipase family protein [Oceanicoccus sp. KOV_DT_Chl]|uniref:GDSL-type esterase/lipase family protein n=1 Tax=Oceanicoccus sp. KOV_DT_Chl TaxID=1904639 RepID=UPI000C7B50CA|nr:GDSL-type esterase/lipase family protein [Oceanicoccus sp. KOV_DT_Chl]